MVRLVTGVATSIQRLGMFGSRSERLVHLASNAHQDSRVTFVPVKAYILQHQEGPFVMRTGTAVQATTQIHQVSTPHSIKGNFEFLLKGTVLISGLNRMRRTSTSCFHEILWAWALSNSAPRCGYSSL